ncbi:rhamnan synthesis F family protein [Lachnospiraceae bacterium 56-18]
MNRTGIFCLYTPTGEIDSTITFTLKDLKRSVSYLIIVVNGYINNNFDLSDYADKIVIRDNVGLDVGAYTEIILSPDYVDKIKNSDELVLCNSSFYGPFISFKDIFYKMENNSADFWGISSSEKNFVQHIQSYFLVFRRKILEGGELFCYLKNRVDLKKMDYFGACSIFENGLFWTLKNAGYRFDAYKRNIDCDNYLNPYGSVKIDELPILKKKIFSKDFYQKRKVLNALSYIKKNYQYDIKLILDNAFCEHGIKISDSEIKKSIEEVQQDLFQDHELIEREEVERFIAEHEKIFIYGNGIMAKMIYSCFFFYENNPKLIGFIVSDNQAISERDFRGYPIYRYSEIKVSNQAAILVALNKYNAKEVTSCFKERKNIKFLWKDFV